MQASTVSRHSIRLAPYDYASRGAYFVTICTHTRFPLLGRIAGERMVLSLTGEVSARCWNAIPQHYSSVELDAFVVMPNHVHGILLLTNLMPGEATPLKAPTLGTVVANFKAAVSREVGRAVWQRGYYEHILRSERDLEQVRGYIEANPLNGGKDPENANAVVR